MEAINAYLPELMAFHQVAKCGGFTQAAEKLNLSKAQLSKQVARLEMVLKAQLFIRTTRRMSLTEEGKHLLHYSEGIVNLSREATMSLKEMTDKEGGLIRITAPSSLGDWFSPELLKVFRQKMPELKVEIDLSNSKRDLVADNYDFALRALEETNPDFIARYLGQIKDIVCATPEFIKLHKIKGDEPLDVKNYPCLLNSHQKSWNTWKLQHENKDVVVEVHGNYACSSYATSRLMCLANLGVARLPHYLVETDLKQRRLVNLYPDYTIATHPLYLVYSGRGYNSKKQKMAKIIIWDWMKGQKGIWL